MCPAAATASEIPVATPLIVLSRNSNPLTPAPVMLKPVLPPAIWLSSIVACVALRVIATFVVLAANRFSLI